VATGFEQSETRVRKTERFVELARARSEPS